MSDITIFETVGKIAGIGGVAIIAAMYLFKDIIKNVSDEVIGPENTYKLLRLLMCLFTFISIAGITAWMFSIWIGRHPDISAEIEKAKNDKYFLLANDTYIKTNDFKKSFELYKKSANENNNFISMGHVSTMYATGQGTSKDERMAENFAEKSAQTLDEWCSYSKKAEPCFSLSILLQNGIYIKKDKKRSLELKALAASQGYIRSYLSLGGDYFYDDETKSNRIDGINFIIKAAENGNVNAMMRLYTIFIDKSYYNYDQKIAINWLSESASKGNSHAQYYLGKNYIDGNILKKNKIEGVKWLEKSAKNEDVNAINYLGQMYVEGSEATPKNYDLAKNLFLQALKLGSTEAFNYLGALYDNNIKDYNQAFYYFSRGVESGDSQAMMNLAKMYYNGRDKGRGFTIDYKKSAELLIKSANLMNSDAQVTVAECYYGPCKGFEKNEAKSEYWALKATQNNDESVFSLLGRIYANKGDKLNAIKWLDKSIQKDQEDGWLAYGSMYEVSDNSESSIVVPDNDKALYYYTQAYKKEPNNVVIANAYWFFRARFMKNKNEKKLAFEELKKLSISNDSCVQYSIATIYSWDKMTNEAVEWYIKSAQNGNSCSQIKYASLLLKGDYLPQDIVAAIEWLNKADASHDPFAAYNLGVIYIEGKYTNRNIQRGLKYLEKSAAKNNTKALLYLSKLYSDGTVINMDKAKGLDFFNTAVKLGDPDALYEINHRDEFLTCSGNPIPLPISIVKNYNK